MPAGDRTPFRNLRAVLRVPRTVHVLPDGGDVKVSYTSVLTDFDQSSFYLTQPAKGTAEMPLGVGDAMRIVYYGDDAVYDFSTEVIACHAGPRGGRRYEATIPEECWRLQRRDSYRLPIRLEAEYRELAGEPGGAGRPVSPGGAPHPCLVTDISGSGLSLRLDAGLAVGATIEVSFTLDDAGRTVPIREKAEVVRVWAPDEGTGTGFARGCGGRFVDIDEQVRNRLLRFVFVKQMEKLAERRG